jgi:hypothetical protein
MPRYVAVSESPISVVSRPDLPDWGSPEHPWVPGGEGPGSGGPPLRPGHGLPPQLPPREEWPPLPPFFEPGVGLPIPPTVEHPMVPIPDDPGSPDTGFPPGVIWPPVRPELPDLSGKTLALVRVYVSRHVNYLAWTVIDHAKAKEAFDKLKDRLPAGGVGGRPPPRPGNP